MDSAPLCVKFTGTNYSTWAFQFELFLKGKDLWGHIDGTDVEKPSTFDKSQDVGTSHSWAVLDARIMSWLLGSVEPHIVTHLRPHRSAQSMWAYLKKVYHQDNDARRFQLEHAIAMFQHGSLSIQDYYSAFLTLWHEYADLVTADVPIAALSTIQTIHATTRRDQFLMKLRPEYESVRSSLLNRSPVPSLDICLFGTTTVAYAAQGREPPMHSKNLQCFCCKEYGHIAATCPKKFCLIARRKVTLSKNVVFAPRIVRPKHFNFGYCPSCSNTRLSFSCVLCSCTSCTRLLHPRNGATDINFSIISNGFKDQVTGKPIAKGPKVGRLFPLFLPVSDFSPRHPNTQILSHVLHSDLPGNKDHYSLSLECDSCKLGKSKTLPFPLHASRASHCFDLIHSDVWDFPAYVDNQFSTSIKTLRTDSGVLRSSSSQFSLSTRYCVYETLPPQSLSVAHRYLILPRSRCQSVATPSVRRSSRVSVPPNRYGFPSSSSWHSISALTAALSKFDIPHATHMLLSMIVGDKLCRKEIAALEANHTWDIEPCPPTIVPLGCKWVYSVKVRSDGSLDRYKARLVALGNNQEYGVNYEETFAPVAKMTTVRTILALAASSDWPLHQMDSKYDTSLFLRKLDMGIVVLLVYVDDIVITGSILLYLVHHSPSGISLNQHKYASDLVATAGLQGATSVDTPMELNVKLRKEEGDLLADPSLYRKLVGSLVYLTITRPDISFAVQQVSQFLQTPRHLHLAAVRRIIRYVQGTSTRGLFFPAGNSTRLAAYSDADWAGCADTRRSITGWCVFLGDALISWKSKKQDRVSKSSTESEYRAMSLACSEIIWLRGLLAELDFSETDPTPLHADNTSAIQITANPVYHERTKHIEVDCHSIREAFEARVITLPHISTDLQIADIFTKALPRHRHCLLSSKLMLVDQPASI
ncbi:Retrovirus-related Pol polyprotein from transposon RE1 [Vitis vinifera]|uniref:Retrovirus-related Pol polyprotein from transposon RE1 n=1 Tax=Vitis vinifera TaxID=29760 RepID=A0A438HZJ9_VITVI|nr:Retrovirus-related Pol polyprotein from transposon RE1 [Vitis vinifera]